MFDLILKEAKKDFEKVDVWEGSQVFVIRETDTQKLELWVSRHLEPIGIFFEKVGDICEVRNHPRSVAS